MICASGDAALEYRKRPPDLGRLAGGRAAGIRHPAAPDPRAAVLRRWKRGRAALSLDLNLPGYSQLRERLMPSSERLWVNDAAPEQLHHVTGGVSELKASALLVAIELDDQLHGRRSSPASVKDAGILDSRESRNKLLEQLTRFPPARLAIACDPRRSPDRGSLALIAELARSATATGSGCCKRPPAKPRC